MQLPIQTAHFQGYGCCTVVAYSHTISIGMDESIIIWARQQENCMNKLYVGEAMQFFPEIGTLIHVIITKPE